MIYGWAKLETIKIPKLVGFGGCMLNNPLQFAAKAGLIDNTAHRAMGFRRTPAAFTTGAIVQLIRFVSGEIVIPLEIQPFCFVDDRDVRLTDNAADVLRTRDLALIELVTPVETVFDGWNLNYNFIISHVESRLAPLGPGPVATAKDWRSKGLMRHDEEARRGYARRLLDVYPNETEEDWATREVIGRAHGVQRSMGDISAGLVTVRDMLPIPIAMLLHTYRYMPDGRTISWPTSFMSDVTAAAAELDIPLLRPENFVRPAGVATAMADDFRHYRPTFYPKVGEELAAFALAHLSFPAQSLG